MSSSIESRIVTMKFDNASFKSGVGSTLDLLSKLKLAVTGLPSSTKSIGEVNAAANKFSMGNVQNEVNGVTHSFSVMGAAAITAIATIAHKATTAGLQIANSLSFAPIMSGLKEYETNLNSVQTIMANTGLEGQKGLDIVTDALDELNHYSDKTIYNFSEMARNIGTFTAAGVELDKSVAAIKGIANLAAVSGSTSQQASTAMYQLSQALAAGKVTLMDWNSVVNAGMGGQILKDALMETARVHGVAVDKIIADSGSFRDSISEGWVTGEILTETLAKFTGDLSEAQLRSMGYTEAQIEGIIKMGQVATDAATKVKTASALINTLQETATSGWSKTWSLILGDFFEARIMFTKANDAIGGMLSESARQRNKMFREWNEMGGRYVAIEAITNAFHALLRILRPIRNAFQEVFPPMTGEGLFNLTELLRDFTEGLLITKPTMRDIRNIFEAVFGVIGVGVDVVQGVAKWFATLFGLWAPGTSGLLDLVAGIAKIISGFTEWIRAGDKIGDFFDTIIAGRNAVLGPIIEQFGEWLSILAGFAGVGAEAAIEAIADALAFMAPYVSDLAVDFEAVGVAVERYLVDSFEKLKPLLDQARDSGVELGAFLVESFEKLKPVLDEVREAIANAFGSLSGLGGNVGGALGGLAGLFDLGDSADKTAEGIELVKSSLEGAAPSTSALSTGMATVIEVLKTAGAILAGVGAFIASVLAEIWNEITYGLGQLGSNSGEVISNIGSFFGDIFNTIGEFIGNISFADIVVGLNTALIAGFGLAFVNLLYQFGQFFKDMRGVFQSVGGVFDQVTSNLKTMQTDVRSGIILKIAIALGILAVSLAIISTIDSAALARSLAAVGAMLIALVYSIKFLEDNLPDATTVADAVRLGSLSAILVSLGLALLAISVALKILASLSVGELAKGLTAMVVVLAAIVGATVALNKSGGGAAMLQAAVSIGVLAFALTALAAAIKLYSALDAGMLAEGGAKIAAILIALGLAMNFMPVRGSVGAAFAIAVMAGSLVLIAGSLKLLASLSGGDSFQSILTLAAALTVLAVAANAMTGTAAGAGAMIVMAGALAILIPQLVVLGNLSWTTIVVGLVALAGIFAVLGLSAALLAPLAPIILMLAIGIGLLGIAVAAVGAGMLLFATGLNILATVGLTAVAILIEAINMFLDAIPGFLERFGVALVEAAKQIEQAGPAFIRAGSAIIAAFLRAIIKNVPLAGKAFRTILTEFFLTVRALTPDFIATGFFVLMEFLGGLLENIGEITKVAVKIIVEFINGIANNMDRIVQAGVRLVGKFVGAVAGEIANLGWKVASAAGGIAGDLIEGLRSGIANLWYRVVDEITALADKLPGPLKSILGIQSPSTVMMELGGYISEGLAIGIGQKSKMVQDASDKVGRTALDTLKSTMAGLSAAMDSDMDLSPRVTPVLDLSKMANEASKIGTMLDTQPLVAGVSYAQASDISEQMDDSGPDDGGGGGGEPHVEINNTYNTPKAPNASEVYRNNKSVIAHAKEALKKK